MDIAKEIRNLRIKNHYTQETLAGLCGISRQAVAKWEAGINFPNLDMVLRLAQVFEVSTDRLLMGEAAPAKGNDHPGQKNICYENEKIVNQALEKAMAFENPNEEINQFISIIGKQIAADRVFIFEANTDGSYKNTYEWCKKGIPAQIDYLQKIPPEDISAWISVFSRGEHIVIEDLEEKYESEPAVYRWLKPQGIQSVMAYPLFGGRAFIGVDNPAPAFIRQTSALIEIMIHFIATMLQRRDLMRELQWSDFKNDILKNLSNSVRYRINMTTGRIDYDANNPEEKEYPSGIYSIDEMKALFFGHPEFCDHVMADGIRKAIDSKQNTSIEFLSYKSNRQLRWNKLSICPFIDSHGKVLQLYGVVQDTSAEHSIVEQYNKYVSQLSGGIHICYLSRPIHLEYGSDDLCNFLGYSREEFEQVTSGKYTNIIVNEDRAVFKEYAQRLAAAPGIASCEYRLQRKDGSSIEVIDTMESVVDGSGIMYGYAYIIAKSQVRIMLHMAEENEKRQLCLIDRQLELLRVLGKDYTNIYKVSLDDDRAQIIQLNGYVTQGISKESTEYFSYCRFCRQYIQDRVHPDDRKRMLSAMNPDTVRKAFTNGKEYNVIYRILDNGEVYYCQITYIWLQESEGSGKENIIVGFKNVDRLIKKENIRNEQLQDKLNIINAILHVFSCAYYGNCQTGSFTELCNSIKPIADMIGKSGNVDQNRNKVKCVFPDPIAFGIIDNFIDSNTIDERLNGQKYISEQVEVKGYGWFEMYLFVVDYNESGRVAHYIVAARDISEDKKKEEGYILSLDDAGRREQEAMKAAETANHAKTSFLFNISHDIRTPMNAIIGYSKLIEKHSDDRELCRCYIRKLQSSGEFLLSLLSNILEVARIENGRAKLDEEICDIGCIQDAIMDIFADMMRDKNIEFVCRRDIHTEYVWADRPKLNEVFLNLISNSYKYTPAGGRIEMLLQEIPCEKPGWITIRTAVKDNGIGMSSTYMPAMYEDFSRERTTTESRNDGIGLGLSLAKKMIDIMHGKIEAESVLGKGTVFTVTISHRVAEKESVEIKDTESADIDKLAGKRILLAEDNDLNAEIAEEILKGFGMTAERAADGVICIDMLRKSAMGYYDLILMDIQMPNMDGYKAAQTIRAMDDQYCSRIPIIAMTANAFEEDKQNALAAGMNGHIAKPINVAQMVNELVKNL